MATLVKSDAQIRADVIDEMAYDPAVTVRDVAVVVERGIVTLSGVADSYGTRQAAEQAAWRVGGVIGVNNNIVVDPTQLGMPTDAEITAYLRDRMEKDFLVPKGRITVSVRDGIVTLRGTVDLHLQREAAYEEAEDARGVRGVNNEITIGPSQASPQEITAAIQKALTRDAQVEADNIHVIVDGGHVTLAGEARSFAERQAAEDAAWRARGVTDVTDNIAIQPF
jgi:osmotically-inducible protein OsmY